MGGHFAAVFIHNFATEAKDVKVLGVTDVRFPRDVKMPGGMAEAVSGNGGHESPEETMKREAVSETGVQIVSGRLVFHQEIPPRRGQKEKHHQFFFLAETVSGLPKLDAPPREVTEVNPSDGTSERLTSYWLPIREFAHRLYRGQHVAFGAILGELARNEEFFNEYGDLMKRFPAPEEDAE